MQALLIENGNIRLDHDYPQPVPLADEALVRVTLAGICSTDLEIINGYYQYQGVMGHEFTGVVEACADASWVGRRVVGSINLGCRNCPECHEHGPEHCPQRRTLGIWQKDGIFAEYQTLPIVNLFPIPDGVPDEVAVFVEPLAAALRLREQLIIPPSQPIAVIGPGRLGLLVGKVLSLSGTEAIMLGRSEASLRLPKAWGLATGFVQDMADNQFRLVVEATGNEDGLRQALRLVRPRGTLALKSTFAGSPSINLTKIVVAEITVVGSRCGPFAPAMRLLAQGQIPVQSSIDGEYPLAQGAAALHHAAQPGVRKILLRISPS